MDLLYFKQQIHKTAPEIKQNVTKQITVGTETFTFRMYGRQIINESEFNRLVKFLDRKIRGFCFQKSRETHNKLEAEDIYIEAIYRLWRCLYTYNNNQVARTQARASFETYFFNILKKAFINMKVTATKERTIKRLKESADPIKRVQGIFLEELMNAEPLSLYLEQNGESSI